MDLCISNIHDDPVEATTWGKYVNGEHVAYYHKCAATAEALRFFVPDDK